MTDKLPPELAHVELFAYLGEDEFGSREIGIKQATVPAGLIPMVAVRRDKMETHFAQLEAQAAVFGRRIYLCRFQLVEVLRETEHGQ
jgi:hypothetical protein